MRSLLLGAEPGRPPPSVVSSPAWRTSPEPHQSERLILSNGLWGPPSRAHEAHLLRAAQAAGQPTIWPQWAMSRATCCAHLKQVSPATCAIWGLKLNLRGFSQLWHGRCSVLGTQLVGWQASQKTSADTRLGGPHWRGGGSVQELLGSQLRAATETQHRGFFFAELLCDPNVK